jgi:hypothetical protein
MARSKADKKPKTANECRMRAKGVEGGNKRTPIDIGDPFKGKAPSFVSGILATHLMWFAFIVFYFSVLYFKIKGLPYVSHCACHCLVWRLNVCHFAAASQFRRLVLSRWMARSPRWKHLGACKESEWKGWNSTRSLLRRPAQKGSCRVLARKGGGFWLWYFSYNNFKLIVSCISQESSQASTCTTRSIQIENDSDLEDVIDGDVESEEVPEDAIQGTINFCSSCYWWYLLWHKSFVDA